MAKKKRLPKFGSPAWRKKYGLDKKRKGRKGKRKRGGKGKTVSFMANGKRVSFKAKK